MMFFLRLKIYILLLFIFTQKSYANEDKETHTKTESKPQVPMVKGISTRLLPTQSQTITYPETYFSFGVYREYLIQDTQNNYDAVGLGVILGFDQHIRGMWSGGVELRWSDWKAKTSSSLSNTSPLSLYSKVAVSPRLNRLLKNETLSKMIRPYATGAFGYTFFFDNRSLLAAKSKTAFGQVSATYGGGFRVILPASFAIKIGAEEWRGIQDSNYFSRIIFLELSIGDVDKF